MFHTFIEKKNSDVTHKEQVEANIELIELFGISAGQLNSLTGSWFKKLFFKFK